MTPPDPTTAETPDDVLDATITRIVEKTADRLAERTSAWSKPLKVVTGLISTGLLATLVAIATFLYGLGEQRARDESRVEKVEERAERVESEINALKRIHEMQLDATYVRLGPFKEWRESVDRRLDKREDCRCLRRRSEDD